MLLSSAQWCWRCPWRRSNANGDPPSVVPQLQCTALQWCKGDPPGSSPPPPTPSPQPLSTFWWLSIPLEVWRLAIVHPLDEDLVCRIIERNNLRWWGKMYWNVAHCQKPLLEANETFSCSSFLDSRWETTANMCNDFAHCATIFSCLFYLYLSWTKKVIFLHTTPSIFSTNDGKASIF